VDAGNWAVAYLFFPSNFFPYYLSCRSSTVFCALSLWIMVGLKYFFILKQQRQPLHLSGFSGMDQVLLLFTLKQCGLHSWLTLRQRN